MPTLEAGTYYPANTPESNKRLGKIILKMIAKAERERAESARKGTVGQLFPAYEPVYYPNGPVPFMNGPN